MSHAGVYGPRIWRVYLVRACNGALYCGISDDPWRRFAQHARGRGARFFRSSGGAQALVYVEACGSQRTALARERAIKRLGKPAKEQLVSGWSGQGLSLDDLNGTAKPSG